MLIHVKINYVLGDGTRQIEKNKIVARKKELICQKYRQTYL